MRKRGSDDRQNRLYMIHVAILYTNFVGSQPTVRVASLLARHVAPALALRAKRKIKAKARIKIRINIVDLIDDVNP